MPTAILFPGQGSHQPGMRDLVAAAAPDLLERCIHLVGEDPFEWVTASTSFAQPAIFCASVAGWRRLAAEGADPVAVAGHSLGELSALVAADALDAAEALELVVLRGRLMAEADRDGSMLALLGTDDDTAEALAHAHRVSVANLNAPGQVVLSGPADALARAAADARAHGHQALELGVAGAFHSPAMAPAVPAFAAAVDRVAWRPPRVPVISCRTAAPMTDPPRELAAALTEPVRWSDTMRALVGMGADRFVDAGPGRVLARLVRRTVPEALHV